MSDNNTSIWYVILPILLTGVFSAVSWVVRGKFERNKQLHSQYAFMKTDLRLKNLKSKLEEFYWPVYLRLVRHLHYTKRFHKLNNGELYGEITPLEEHVNDEHFLPFTSNDQSNETAVTVNMEQENEVKSKPSKSSEPIVDIKEATINEEGTITNSDDMSDIEMAISEALALNVCETTSEKKPSTDLCLEIKDLLDEVIELDNKSTSIQTTTTLNMPDSITSETSEIFFIHPTLNKEHSKVNELIEDLKIKTNKLMYMKKAFNKIILDNLLEIKSIFENKTAISTPDQLLGINLLKLDSFVATYKSSYESGDVYMMPTRITHGIEFPFEIINIVAKKLSNYQQEYDNLIKELDELKDEH